MNTDKTGMKDINLRKAFEPPPKGFIQALNNVLNRIRNEDSNMGGQCEEMKHDRKPISDK